MEAQYDPKPTSSSNPGESQGVNIRVFAHPETVFYSVCINEMTQVSDVLSAISQKKETHSQGQPSPCVSFGLFFVYPGATHQVEKQLSPDSIPLDVMNEYGHVKFIVKKLTTHTHTHTHTHAPMKLEENPETSTAHTHTHTHTHTNLLRKILD
eukprot:GHVR01089011.1.p1 GENE.GHVR01089011.1~~GHVR01089011.1.p1  ORF type:complete len:153 (-),score=65.22 GHVR01089011.1:275-733(-)